MTRGEMRKWGRYVRSMADDMGLRDWTISLHDGCQDSNAYATCQPTEGRKHAVISLCDEWGELDPEEQRTCVVHELIHCHMAPAADAIRLGLTKHLKQAVYDAVFDSFMRSLEYGVDGVADAVSTRLPLLSGK